MSDQSNENTVVRQLPAVLIFSYGIRRIYLKENAMWTKPAAQDQRFGFEVTMYIAAR